MKLITLNTHSLIEEHYEEKLHAFAEMVRKEKPDILITDIRMPFMDGLELSRLVKEELPDIKILILTVKVVLTGRGSR